MERARVARLNIEHYERLLATETNEIRREIALRLLIEEQEILTKIVRDGALNEVPQNLWRKVVNDDPTA